MQNDSSLAVQESLIPEFKKVVAEKCEKLLDLINQSHRKYWVMWSRWAVRMTILGFLCMIFQFSSGFLSIFMLAPVIGTWILSLCARKRLFDQIGAVEAIAGNFRERILRKSQDLEQEVNDGLDDVVGDSQQGQLPLEEKAPLKRNGRKTGRNKTG